MGHEIDHVPESFTQTIAFWHAFDKKLLSSQGHLQELQARPQKLCGANFSFPQFALQTSSIKVSSQECKQQAIFMALTIFKAHIYTLEVVRELMCD